MPREWFARDLDQLGDADVTHAQTLAKKYKTSLEATSNRYTDLSPDACSFVFSKDGVIRYIRPTSQLSAASRGSWSASSASLRKCACPGGTTSCRYILDRNR
jgi:hypothetical protein